MFEKGIKELFCDYRVWQCHKDSDTISCIYLDIWLNDADGNYILQKAMIHINKSHGKIRFWNIDKSNQSMSILYFLVKFHQLLDNIASFILNIIPGPHSFISFKTSWTRCHPIFGYFWHHLAFENKLIIFLWLVMTIDDLYYVLYICVR